MYLPSAEETPELPASAPDSVRATWHVLRPDKPLTGKELKEATGLPRRTVYTAITRLRELGLINERQSLHDTRQTYFWRKG